MGAVQVRLRRERRPAAEAALARSKARTTRPTRSSAYRQLRQATLSGTLEVPDVDLEKDIGGYAKVKKRLTAEILDVLSQRDKADRRRGDQRGSKN